MKSVCSKLLGLVLFASAAHTQQVGLLDLSLGGGYRWLPRGAAIAAEAGYGWPVWGQAAAGQPFYGYVRPVARAQASGFVNRGEIAVDLAPVSFVVFSYAKAWVQRNVDLATLDCDRLECRGVIDRDIFSLRAMAARGPWFGLVAFRFENLTPPNADRKFGDEGSNLTGRRGGDDLRVSSIVGGYTLNDEWKVGASFDTAHMRGTGANNTYLWSFGRWTPSPEGTWTFSLGAYRSSTQATAPTVAVGYTHTFRPGIALR